MTLEITHKFETKNCYEKFYLLEQGVWRLWPCHLNLKVS
jgi:hypothetical protein